MDHTNICWIILSYIFSPDASLSYQKKISRSLPQRFAVCMDVAQKAKDMDFDPIMAASVAYHETRFTYTKSKKNAKGPLGVLTKYHCPKKGKCDLTQAGIHALKKFYARNPKNPCNALAQYNAGLKASCSTRSPASQYAERVLDLYYDVKFFNQKEQFDFSIK